MRVRVSPSAFYFPLMRLKSMEQMIAEQYADLQKTARQLAEKYQHNQPFPNIYIDHFFDADFLSQVLAEFPDMESVENKIHYTNPNENKLASRGQGQLGPKTRELVNFLNSLEFLNFLQTLTGIKETLVADPDLEGGGYHEIKSGGFLKIHVDFHMHMRTKLSRRLNLLIYLNKDWEESYGGHFELWEKDMSARALKILPVFNRMALFSTTGDSWHGHPDPLNCPPNRSRKSLALYYYSDGRPESELSEKERNRITTTFQARPQANDSSMNRYNNFVNLMNRVLPKPLISLIKKFRNK
ncbi:MAG: 2OG-Fe(II) oxygenase [Calditrichaeota bacterium]|nr:2OG-Fe(II) oxygenase [Calditrichota bacterium]